MTITFAHRGARLDEPENTIPAFERALGAGVTGIETDVWRSADGEIVCSHDPTVRRGRRRLRIAESTAAELAELSVPRLADVYEELGTAFECSVDVKSPDAAVALIDVARRYEALERLWVCSPDLDVLRPLRSEPAVKLVHSYRRSAILGPLERHAYELGSIGIDAMNLHHSEWTAGLVRCFTVSTYVRSPGTPKRCGSCERCCACTSTRCTAIVPTEWSRPWPNGTKATRVKEAQARQRPYAHKDAAHDLALRNGPEDTRVFGIDAVVSHHPIGVGRNLRPA